MKKIISLLLCAALLVSGTVFAAASPAEKAADWESSEAGEILKNLNVMLGMPDGQLKLDRNVTRAEALTLIERMTAPCFSKAGDVSLPFEDMKDHWAKSTALRFYANGLVKGTSAFAFTPDRPVTGKEFTAILLRAMGYQDAEPAQILETAVLANLDKIPWRILDAKVLTRGEAAQICVAAFDAVCKNGVPLSKVLTEAGIYTEAQLEAALAKDPMNYGNAAVFADKLFARLPENKNFMASPLSVKMALAMAANGAGGETRSQILNAAEIENLDVFNRFSQAAIAKYGKTDLMKLEIANSAWINESRTSQTFNRDYRDKMENFYDGELGRINNDNGVKTVNDWVNGKTRGKIPAIIDNNDFWAILVNAIYFKGAWENEFSEDATKEAEFTNLDGTKTTMDFMHRTAWMNYCKTENVKILELPYKYRASSFDENGEYLWTDVYEDLDVSMYILLSDENVDKPAQAIEKCLSGDNFKQEYVRLSLPKFKIEYSASLKDVLKKMGIQDAFGDESADFSRMFDRGNMWIDDVLHKTFISVDEKGTEAAAVTAVGMAGTSLPPQPIELNVNKPFTFLIRDNANGEILFIGTYSFAE